MNFKTKQKELAISILSLITLTLSALSKTLNANTGRFHVKPPELVRQKKTFIKSLQLEIAFKLKIKQLSKNGTITHKFLSNYELAK